MPCCPFDPTGERVPCAGRRATDAECEPFDLDVWFLALADLADLAADALIIFADAVRDEA